VSELSPTPRTSAAEGKDSGFSPSAALLTASDLPGRWQPPPPGEEIGIPEATLIGEMEDAASSVLYTGSDIESFRMVASAVNMGSVAALLPSTEDIRELYTAEEVVRVTNVDYPEPGSLLVVARKYGGYGTYLTIETLSFVKGRVYALVQLGYPEGQRPGIVLEELANLVHQRIAAQLGE
jgi:hypothetical protein